MPIDDSYNDVPARIAEFREKYPDGALQQHGLQFVTVANVEWIVYTAAAYRSPEDPRPGHGTAWERVPGLTNFTRNSELQNAETSAWGRAIIAALAADAKKSDGKPAPIASLSEVQARQAERDPQALKDALKEAYAATTKAELRPLYQAVVSLGASPDVAAKLRAHAAALPEKAPQLDPADPKFVAAEADR